MQPLQIRGAARFRRFEKEETEQSIAERFEKQVRKYPERLACKTANHTLTYEALNRAANRVAHSILAESRSAGHSHGLHRPAYPSESPG